ncbi:MAG TPA: methyltransferase domain-containing protein [Candidatus Dormibacteraeota bacterium]|nr:methyltransferase domain-containing protein [Candidatus Dormibacteraeota bacterium]
MSLKTFVGEAITNFSTVAAVSPSSKYLATAMLEPLALGKARVAVELGAGTGAITHALLEQLPPQAKLLAFEINPRFLDCLQRSISDPRVILINASVENLDSELRQRGIEQVDAVTSSLGLAFMPERERQALFERLSPFLHRNSVFTQFQYIHGLQCVEGRLCRLNLRSLLIRYFGSVQSKIVWRNLPPAFVFTCHAQAL